MATLSAVGVTDAELWYAGDSRTLSFEVNQDDGTDLDITGASLTWQLFGDAYTTGSSNTEIDDGDSDVEITVTDASKGLFEVTVDQGATSGLWGEHHQRVTVDPKDDSKQTWRGSVIIEA